MNLEDLQRRIQGGITTSTDTTYDSVRRAIVWNQLVPERSPKVIVAAASENDVVEAVKFARANGIKIAVRGGGHNWLGFSLRDDSLLIDLGRLNKVSIDRKARIARIQPALTGRELNLVLGANGLAFPVGHCPMVPMSGFLLSGGIGWNFNSWNPACFSIEAAKVVTADANVVVASEQQNSDLLWAVRGGGPGFFGVVTEYSLRLYAAPRAITTSNYYYSLDDIDEVGAWAGTIARKLPKEVELTVVLASAPPSIGDRCRSSNDFVCVVSATAFVDTSEDAKATLKLLETCPGANRCLQMERELPTPIDVLHETGVSWPENHRYLGDTIWTNSSPGEVLRTLRAHFLHASAKCSAFFVFSTGADRSPFPDAAYSMRGDALVLCYAVWERHEDDAANTAWQRATITALDQFAVGHYVGESDIVADPGRAERSYSKGSWERLRKLRLKYDPNGLFHGHFGAR